MKDQSRNGSIFTAGLHLQTPHLLRISQVSRDRCEMKEIWTGIEGPSENGRRERGVQRDRQTDGQTDEYTGREKDKQIYETGVQRESWTT